MTFHSTQTPALSRQCSHCGSTTHTATARFCHACGQALPASTSQTLRAGYQPATTPSARAASPLTTRLLDPRILLAGRYRIKQLLGQGGMGAVYRATDLRFESDRAVKEMRTDALFPGELPQAISAFEQEARLLANLMHPNLPRIYDHFSEDGRWYIVMDYIEGQSLEHRLQQAGGRLPAAEVLSLGITLCRILEYLHSRRPPIIFRDLKPSNVMRTPDGQLYLIDFGIARHFRPGQAKDTAAMGTAGYAAPEQYGSAQTDERSDLYSLATVLHQCWTGDDPTASPFVFRSVHDPTIPASADMQKLLVQMHAPDPLDRPQSAQAVRTRLEALAAHVTDTLGLSPRPSRTLASAASDTTTGAAVELLLLYDGADADASSRLEKHLSSIKRRLPVPLRYQHNRETAPGKEQPEWPELIEQATLVLAFVSPDFYANETLMDVVDQVRQRGKRLVPIWLRPCADEEPCFGLLSAPRDKPISAYGRNKDEAWYLVAQEMSRLLRELRPDWFR